MLANILAGHPPPSSRVYLDVVHAVAGRKRLHCCGDHLLQRKEGAGLGRVVRQ